jgi:lipopolysaccharide transport system permease protein
MSRLIVVLEPPALSRIRPLADLRRLAQFTDLFLTLSFHRVKVRYKQSQLGPLWALLQPLAMMLVFTLMFTVLRAQPTDRVPFPLFAYAALMPWSMFSSGLTSASAALTSHAALLTKVYFPREILPLTYVMAALIDLAVAGIGLAVLMAWYGVSLAATALWAIPAVLLLTLLLAALGLLFAALQVSYRDVGLAMPVVMQIWLFASPVLYPLSAVKQSLPQSLYALYILNPITGIVDTFRRGVILHQEPDFEAFAAAALVTLALLPLSYVYFKYAERTMADIV